MTQARQSEVKSHSQGVVSSAPVNLEPTVKQNHPAQKQPSTLFSFHKASLPDNHFPAFGPNAAGPGQPKDKATQKGLPGVKPEAQSKLPITLPTESSYVARVNIPAVAGQRGGFTASAVSNSRANHGGVVKLEDVCPCTLLGHDCGCQPG